MYTLYTYHSGGTAVGFDFVSVANTRAGSNLLLGKLLVSDQELCITTCIIWFYKFNAPPLLSCTTAAISEPCRQGTAGCFSTKIQSHIHVHVTFSEVLFNSA